VFESDTRIAKSFKSRIPVSGDLGVKPLATLETSCDYLAYIFRLREFNSFGLFIVNVYYIQCNVPN